MLDSDVSECTVLTNSLLQTLKEARERQKERFLNEQIINTHSDQVVEGQKQSAHSHLALPLNLEIILL